jgi:hypothetical protein
MLSSRNGVIVASALEMIFSGADRRDAGLLIKLGLSDMHRTYLLHSL